MSSPAPETTPLPKHLFAYGTLLPGEPRWHVLEPFVVDGGSLDAAEGALFDTGEGYPAAVFDDALTLAGRRAQGADAIIHGRVFELDVTRVDEALAVLDEVEGAVGGLYHRIQHVTLAGRTVWAYQYGGGLALRPIVSGSWSDRS